MLQNKLATVLRISIESPVQKVIGAIITVYCLFGQDIKVLYFHEDADVYFDRITITAIVYFSWEIIVSCACVRGYSLSFYFFLDIVSTVSLVLDITSMSLGVAGGAVSQASRASRVGTKASRVVRVLRLVRLLRISKFFKAMLKRQSSRTSIIHEDCSDDGNQHREYAEDIEHSIERGRALSMRINQRVIVIVLITVFVVPQFDTTSQFQTSSDLHQAGVSSMLNAYSTFVQICRTGDTIEVRASRKRYEQTMLLYLTKASEESSREPRIGWIGAAALDLTDSCLSTWNGPAPTFTWSTDEPSPLVQTIRVPWIQNCDTYYMSTEGISLFKDISCPSKLRTSEKTLVSAANEVALFEIVVDLRPYTRTEALLSVYRTIAICVILGIATYIFSESAFNLVLKPIDRMITKVNEIRENPLQASRIENDGLKRHEYERLRCIARYNTSTNVISRWRAKGELFRLNSPCLETDMLERTILRISGLLAIGFGQAGADIVAHNMKSIDPSINVMLPGKRVEAVFVSIKIHHFTMISAVLKDRIVLFMNQVAEIIHGICDEFHGMPNKTEGGSFLVVWRLTDDHERNKKIHDMVIAACIKISIAIRRSLELHQYRSFPPLMQKVRGFRVQLHFGMHRGWAIEGAIGSNLKIDPSYLGPDINLVEKIANNNEYYTTSILASGQLISGCSKALVRRLFRQIDSIQLRGSPHDLKIYALDIDSRAELLTEYEIENSIQTTSTHISRHRQAREREKRKTSRWEADMLGYIERDMFFASLRGIYDRNPQALDRFRKGFLNFQVGEWEVAIEALQACLVDLREDGPSLKLIQYIENFQGIPPTRWRGSRS
jgi:class 3 adenylate cyclase